MAGTRRRTDCPVRDAVISRAMVKLGARDRAQLVVFACEAGLVRPGWTT